MSAQATEHLRWEHDRIRDLLGRLETALEPLDLGEIRKVTESLDALLGRHQRKEQEILFPALLRKASPSNPPVLQLVHEHARQETYAETIRAFLSVLREQNVSAQPLVRACRSLTSFYRDHLRHEETVLFPCVDANLSAPEQEELAARMAEMEAVL
ncbi:MAG: hemerythrin domain-containing protein [Planctomycetota bacterium]